MVLWGAGFYNSGQLFLEEYYTLAVMVRGGIGTPHLDGNTRLCTATAAAALKESFGSDGDPGSLSDIDICDTMFLVGHNVAETQTVLWARVLDRLAGLTRRAWWSWTRGAPRSRSARPFICRSRAARTSCCSMRSSMS